MRTPVEGQLEPMRPEGPQCFVDWRFVKAGFVGWYADADRVGVWEPAPENTVGKPEAPYGIRLQAQPAEETVGQDGSLEQDAGHRSAGVEIRG